MAETLDAVVLSDLGVEADGEATRVAAERGVVAAVAHEGQHGERHAERPGAIRGHDLDLLLREARVVRDLDHLAGLDMIRLFAGLDENRCAEIKNSRRLRAESSRRPPRHRRDAARWRGGAGPTHELIFAQPGVLPLPPRAASSAFTSATMRAMAASSAAFVILAARALAMHFLDRAAQAIMPEKPNPTENPRITPAGCLEAPTLSSCICAIAEAWF